MVNRKSVSGAEPAPLATPPEELGKEADVAVADDDMPSPEKSSVVAHPDATVYAPGADAGLYAPIDDYEGRHRYDPSAQWTEAEEKRLVRRLDWRITGWCCLMFFAMQLDRGNVSQALADNMLDDLDLTTNQYNTGMTIYYASFLAAELPSQMLSKRLGPDVYIPVQMVAWSAVACAQAALPGGVHSQRFFYATRGLLGMLEGGFIPDVVLYLSYFYKGIELPARLAAFWAAYVLTSIVSAFFAYGILHLRGHDSWAGWRWLFVIEGALTAFIGVLSWFYLPASPVQTGSTKHRGRDGGRRRLGWLGAAGRCLRRDSWFSPREEVVLVNRILRDDPGKGRMHNREGVNGRRLWAALRDYDLWPVYILGLTWPVPSAPSANYLTINLKTLQFSTFETTLLTIPATALFFLMLLLWTWLSERYGRRPDGTAANRQLVFVLLGQLYMLPCLVALEVLPTAASPWAWYAVAVVLVGFPYVHPILVGFTSRNSGNIQTRTVSTALYNMAVQASSIISSNIYRAHDAPKYRVGNKVLLGLNAWNTALIVFMMFYYPWRNRQKAKVWDAMTPEEKDIYIAQTVDVGARRLDFRFAY
ncbi:Major facilitator superfamily domain, general substrate transporter [Niveomyces insectorum RCEF 264]|uniref:Major facilitator superfamily domain, general substrate transporter n=1 Tax=Niveomyces insectorum RCEF 264 TaxID=1081102 RepID=A0A167NT30_9HYPO|nr:Major facilitator superfamily domain, general substrate transporter [Niveomyces insectorum RCEF 264]